MAVTQGLGDGYALYNGVKLPNIDSVWTEELKANYGYALLSKNAYASINTDYILFMSSEPIYCGDIGVGFNPKPRRWYSLNSNGWKLEESTSLGGTFISNTPIWSNVDDFSSNSLPEYCPPATTPLPLDGMQVIEWDGDTTGLDGLELSETITAYRVADYTYASNAVCVATHSEGYNEVFDGFGSSDTGWNVGAWALGVKDYGIGISTVEGWNDENSISYVSLLAYTPAAEPETPKWTFNLRDFLSGMASAAASRGVLRRTPIAYLYNGVQLPGLPETDLPYAHILYNSVDDVYVLYADEEESVAMATPAYVLGGGSLVWKLINGVWEVYDTTISGTAIWANYDICFAPSHENAGEIALAASEPIPIYE